MAPVAGWYEDPARRHERRYWDGSRWTDQAADGSLVVLDPLGPIGSAPRTPMGGSAAPGLPAVTARPFAPYQRVGGGLVETSYVGVGDDGTVSVTGRIVPVRHQRAYRIASPIVGVVSFVLLVAALGFYIASTASDGTTAGDSNSGAVAAATVLFVIGIGLAIGMAVWAKIATHAASSGIVTVPVSAVSAVRVGHNARHLWWFLLIGLLALIPYFAGRKVLRISVPVDGPGRPPVRLMMRETTRGDAELIATRLRMGGAG